MVADKTKAMKLVDKLNTIDVMTERAAPTNRVSFLPQMSALVVRNKLMIVSPSNVSVKIAPTCGAV